MQKLKSVFKFGKFTDYVEILDSQRVPVNKTERQKRQGDVPYYGATGQVGWINDYLFNEELVLLGEDGAPFLDTYKDVAYLISGKSWVNNHAHVLKGINGMLNKFLMYYLNTIDFRQYVGGTTRLKLNQGRMKEIPVPIVPTDLQQEIVDEIEKQLTRLDYVVKTFKELKDKIEVYRKSVLKAAFDGKVDNIKDKWIDTKIGDIAKIKYGKGLPKRNRKKLGKIPVYSSAGNTGNHDKYLIDFPTIIVARKGSIGNNFVVNEPCWPIDTVYYLENIKVDIDYLYHLLTFVTVKDNSTAIPSLRRADLEAIKFQYPSKIENQKEIVNEIESKFSIIDQFEKAIDNALIRSQKLRKSILKAAFEGKLT